MNPQRLAHLPEFRVNDSQFPVCKICGGETHLFDCVDFYKVCSANPYKFGLSGIGISYYRCGKCNFIFTDFIDEWSHEEVVRYIYNEDYVKVDPQYQGARAHTVAVSMARHLAGFENLRILDYGSGSGQFAKEMRRLGFQHVDSYDPLSSPAESCGTYDLITCFEVIEHSPNPLMLLADMCAKLSNGGTIIIGQTLQPGNIDDVGGRWWYVAPRNGHVSFFAEETFIALAERSNLLYFRGPEFYMFTRDCDDHVAPLATRMGHLVHLWSLVAPGPGDPPAGWHEVENQERTMFRWSSKKEISWPPFQLKPGSNLIQIPFYSSIRDGFVEQCTLDVDGARLLTRIERRRISGEIDVVKPRICRVTLTTPCPLSPFELRGTPDKRKLGLAVRCS